MAKTEFERFLDRQTQPDPQDDVDWSETRDEWLSNLEELYRDIENFLSDYIVSNKVAINYDVIDLNEEYIGRYKVKRLTITIGRSEVTLLPIARLVIGSQGRVDIEGTAGRSRLLRVPKSATGRAKMVFLGDKERVSRKRPVSDEPIVWKLASPPPDIEFFDLSQDSFLTTLVEVSNG